jgi:hypothetical protein
MFQIMGAMAEFERNLIQQLGSIYEGLLEFHLRIAGEKLAVVKGKGHEVYSIFKELSEREKTKSRIRVLMSPAAMLI